MKFLFLCQSSPLKEGGAETRNREVGLQLSERGHEVTFLCGKTNPGDPAEQNWHGVRILQKKVLPEFLLRKYPFPHYLPLAASNFVMAFHLLRLLRKESFDVVREDISPVPPSGLAAFFRLRGIRRSAVVHNLSPRISQWIKYYGMIFGSLGYLMNLFLRGGFLRFDKIICDSRWFADELKTHPAISNRVEFIPNGVSQEFFYERPSKPREDGPLRLLTVGRLVDIKGHRYLLEAIARLAKTKPGIRLSIYGSGPLHADLLERSRRLGISEIVRFEPPRPASEMPEVYRSHDIFVMPSLFEGFPLALLEAMAGKLPALLSDIAAFHSVMDESSALFFRKADAQDLAEKLEWALEHSQQLAVLAETGQGRAEAYRWESISALELGKMAPATGKEIGALG